ncbi:hypothetical protein TNCV_1002301 [Trichonephila clavipes]|nr:hypothetical protein TNCV_1002301 [Trichonephila clavipes]
MNCYKKAKLVDIHFICDISNENGCATVQLHRGNISNKAATESSHVNLSISEPGGTWIFQGHEERSWSTTNSTKYLRRVCFSTKSQLRLLQPDDPPRHVAFAQWFFLIRGRHALCQFSGFRVEAAFSCEGVFNTYNAPTWALKTHTTPELNQHNNASMLMCGRVSWGTVCSAHTSYRLEWTLTSISSSYRRYFWNSLHMSSHLFSAAWGFNGRGRHFIMEGVCVTIWTEHFQTGGLGTVVPSRLTSYIFLFTSSGSLAHHEEPYEQHARQF